MLVPIESKVLRGAIGAVILLVFLLFAFWLVGRYYQGKLKTEQEENKRIRQAYTEEIARSKAHEAVAIENKLKADALEVAIGQRDTNVKEIDKKYDEAIKRYEDKKASIDDCSSNPDACRKLLCEELRQLGFRCKEPEQR